MLLTLSCKKHRCWMLDILLSLIEGGAWASVCLKALHGSLKCSGDGESLGPILLIQVNVFKSLEKKEKTQRHLAQPPVQSSLFPLSPLMMSGPLGGSQAFSPSDRVEVIPQPPPTPVWNDKGLRNLPGTV